MHAVIILVTQESVLFLGFGQTMVNQCFTEIFFGKPTADVDVHRGGRS